MYLAAVVEKVGVVWLSTRVKMREEGDVVARYTALPGPQHEDCEVSGHIVKMWCGHSGATL